MERALGRVHRNLMMVHAQAVALCVAGGTHDEGDLVQRLRPQCLEIPAVVGTAHMGARIERDGAVQVGALQQVPHDLLRVRAAR